MNGAFTDKTKTQIRERSKGRCEICGFPISSGGQIHHRRPRGKGGTTSAETASAANGIRLHPACHERIEMNRAWARERGYLVPFGTNPETVPVRLPGGWFLLGASGESSQVDGPVKIDSVTST